MSQIRIEIPIKSYLYKYLIHSDNSVKSLIVDALVNLFNTSDFKIKLRKKLYWHIILKRIQLVCGNSKYAEYRKSGYKICYFKFPIRSLTGKISIDKSFINTFNDKIDSLFWFYAALHIENQNGYLNVLSEKFIKKLKLNQEYDLNNFIKDFKVKRSTSELWRNIPYLDPSYSKRFCKKLTNIECFKIFLLYDILKPHQGYLSLAKKFNVSPSTIRNIIKNENIKSDFENISNDSELIKILITS